MCSTANVCINTSNVMASQCCLQGLQFAAVKNCHQTEETSPRVRSQDIRALLVSKSKTTRERNGIQCDQM